MNMQSKDEIPLTLFKGRSISWTDFSFDDNVKVKVKVLNENKVPYVNENIRILPSRYNIDYKIDGNEISFNLTQAGQFSVEIGDDGYKNGLMIFANPTETNIPDENSPDYFVVEPSNNILNASNIPSGKKGIFFKKGGHNIDVFTIPSEIEYIYMADSAWVYGAFLKLEGKGVKIFGRGILSQEKMNYRVAHGIDIRVDNSGVEGITVADFKHFAIRLMGTNNEISWVKTIGGWVYNCDGITAYANSTVKNCFIWANDDAIKVYLNNIHWSDISVWLLNNGGVIQTSWGRTQALNCSIKRVDILRAEWVKAGFNAALLSCVGNRYQEPDRFSEQKDWLIEDVVTENPVPIIFGINPDSYSINHVRNFTLRNWNVKMSVGPVFQNRIKAGNPNTIIDGFVFDNFVFNDILLTQENWLEVLNLDTGRFKTPVVLSGVNKITNQEIRKFKVYPNPVKDILYIDNAQPNSAITVYYTNAVLALQTIGNRIDVSRLHAGYYLIKVDGNKSGIFCKKGD